MYKNTILILAFIFGGCSFKPPMPEVHGEFKYSIEASNISDKWWEDFRDENLNTLVSLALKNNSDLKLASLNLKKSQEALSLVSQDIYPYANLKSEINRQKSRGIRNSFSLNAMLSYEVDLWGRVENSIKAKKSILNATKYDLFSARVSIASQVAKSYFSLLALNQQKNVLKNTLKSYKNSMSYQKKQFKAGAISELNYLQSVAEFQNARIKLSKIEQNINLTNSSLLYLCGLSLDDILYEYISTSDTFPNIPNIPEAISSDILLNRADVASAYEKIKSTNYLVGVAKSEYYPTLSLTGVFGYGSDELENLFKNSTNIWSFGGSFVGKILNFNRIDRKVNMAKIDENIGLINYEKTIKMALKQTRDALQSRKNFIQTKEYLNDFLKSQSKAYNISKIMYKEGEITQLQFLDSQRILLNIQLQNIQTDLDLLNSVIDIYKAFGGGFRI